MKGIISTLLLFCLLVITIPISGCVESDLDIIFIEQPVGGKNLSQLYCIFEGSVINGGQITAAIQWWSSDSLDNNARLEQEESHTFDSESYEQVTTSLAAPDGEVFNGHFWVSIVWSQDDNTDVEERSEKVYCYEGPNTTTR